MMKWLLESNRYKHLIAGLIEYLILLMFGFIYTLNSVAVIGFVTVIISMCSVEYKDVLYGNKWDWLDILSGILIPLIITLIIII